MAEEAFTIKSKPIVAANPQLIVGLPDVGLVSIIACAHMVDSLKMDEIGYVDSELMPPIMFIQGGEPKVPIRIFNKDNIVLILGDVILSTTLLRQLTKSLVRWAKSLNVSNILSLSGAPVPHRLEIDKPKVYGIGVTDHAKAILEKFNVAPLEGGLLVGPYALLVRECMKQSQSSIVLLAESHSHFPDPGASASIIEVLNKILNKNIDVESLVEKSEEIRIKAREIMQRMQMQRAREREIPSMYIR